MLFSCFIPCGSSFGVLCQKWAPFFGQNAGSRGITEENHTKWLVLPTHPAHVLHRMTDDEQPQKKSKPCLKIVQTHHRDTVMAYVVWRPETVPVHRDLLRRISRMISYPRASIPYFLNTERFYIIVTQSPPFSS